MPATTAHVPLIKDMQGIGQFHRAKHCLTCGTAFHCPIRHLFGLKIGFLISEAWNFFCFIYKYKYFICNILYFSVVKLPINQGKIVFCFVSSLTKNCSSFLKSHHQWVTNTVIFDLLISSPLFVCIGVCHIHGYFTFRSKQLMSSPCTL